MVETQHGLLVHVLAESECGIIIELYKRQDHTLFSLVQDTYYVAKSKSNYITTTTKYRC